MQSIRIYFLPLLFLFLMNGLSAQNDFYNEEEKQDKEKTTLTVPVDEEIEYYTEEDYNEAHNIYPEYKEWDEEYYDDEHEREKERRHRDSVGAAIAAEIVFEVVINTAFILATFWQ